MRKYCTGLNLVGRIQKPYIVVVISLKVSEKSFVKEMEIL